MEEWKPEFVGVDCNQGDNGLGSPRTCPGMDGVLGNADDQDFAMSGLFNP